MRTSFHHQSEAQPPNGPLTAATSPDTPSTCPATQSCLRGCAGSCRLLLGSRDIYGRMSREPRSLTLTHRQLWKQCLLPVTCVIGRHHLYELVISTRTRGTGGRCGEQPKDMKYFSGRMAPRGRGAARLGTEPRRYCRGCFITVGSRPLRSRFEGYPNCEGLE